MGTIILVCVLMSLFCAGVFLSMQEGQILSFMREPFVQMIEKKKKEHHDNIQDIKEKFSEDKIEISPRKAVIDYNNLENKKLKELREKYESNIEWENKRYENELFRYKILNPFVLCLYCFASFWGTIAFCVIHYVYLHDFSAQLVGVWLMSVFICLLFNSVIDTVLHKLNIIY